MLYEPISRTRANLATASSMFPRNHNDPASQNQRAKTRPRNSAVTNYYNNFLNTNCPNRPQHNQSSTQSQNRPQNPPLASPEKFFDKYTSGKYLPTSKNAPHPKSVKFSENFFVPRPASLTKDNNRRYSLTNIDSKPRGSHGGLLDDIFTVAWNKTYNEGQAMMIPDLSNCDFSHTKKFSNTEKDGKVSDLSNCDFSYTKKFSNTKKDGKVSDHRNCDFSKT